VSNDHETSKNLPASKMSPLPSIHVSNANLKNLDDHIDTQNNTTFMRFLLWRASIPFKALAAILATVCFLAALYVFQSLASEYIAFLELQESLDRITPVWGDMVPLDSDAHALEQLRK